MSADGRLIAFGQDNGAAGIVDALTLDPGPEIPVGDWVTGMAFVPRSHQLVASDPKGSLLLADADSGQVRWRIRAHKAGINTPSISADGRRMVTASEGNLRFWALPEGRSLGSPLKFKRFPGDVQLRPDGRRVAVALSCRLELWDVRTRRRVRSVDMERDINNARFSPSGRLIVLSGSGGAQVWSTADWTPVTRVFTGHAGAIIWVAISRDDRTLIISGLDGTIRLWDIESDQAVAALPGLRGHVAIGLPAPDGDLIAGYDTGLAYRWDIRPPSLVRQACQIAGRILTRAEWDEFLPRREHEPACRR